MKKTVKILILAAGFIAAIMTSAFGAASMEAALYANPEMAQLGQTITLKMVVTNTGSSIIVGTAPVSLTITGSNGMLTGGPNPSVANPINPGNSTVFTWTYYMFIGTGNFSCSAKGYEDATYNTVTCVAILSNPVTVLTVLPTSTWAFTPTITPTDGAPPSTPTQGDTSTITPTATLTAYVLDTVTDTVTPSPETTPGISATATTTAAISPDLIITGLSNITMNDPVPSCVPTEGPVPSLGIWVYYENQGPASSGAFIIDVNGVTGSAAVMPAYSSASLWIPGPFTGGGVTAVIDYGNAVFEMIEGNNTFTWTVAVPTMPSYCLASYTPTPTLTVYVANTFTATVTPSPVISPTATVTSGILPDLSITNMSDITMDPVPACVPAGGPYPPLGIHLTILNSGSADSPACVVDINGVTATVSSLAAGNTGNVWVQGGFSAGGALAVVDVYGTVPESNESNNSFSWTVAIPTLPADCTPTNTSVITASATCACTSTRTPTVWQTPTVTPMTPAVTDTPTCACIFTLTPTATLTQDSPTAIVTMTPTCACIFTFTPTATLTQSTPTQVLTATVTHTTGIPVISVTPTVTADPTPYTALAKISAGSVISALSGGKTSIRYELKQEENVNIMVFSRNGRLIKSIVSTVKNAGIYSAEWDGVFEDGSKVPAGIYLIKVRIGKYEKTLKVAVKK